MSAADPVPAAPPVATRAGVSRDTARNQILVDHPDALAVTALRTRSLHAREVLVEAAWPGHGPADIDAWARQVCGAAAGEPGAPQAADRPGLPAGADAFHLGQYARVLALQTTDPDDRARARGLLEALATLGVLSELNPQAVQILLHLRALDRDVAGCQELLDHQHVPADVAAAVRADLANPFLTDPYVADPSLTDPSHPGKPTGGEHTGGEHAPPGEPELSAWLELLHTALQCGTPPGLELAQPRLAPGPGAPFDRLGTAPLPRADQGKGTDPLVTVVVSAYRPGPPLLTAVRSLLDQSWQRLEILVVDDASGSQAQPWLQQAEALDPRVRVIRKAVNGGTYRARNTALRQARGAYLTTLDSDDWLHPQAIATLVTALEEDPALVAARGLGVRVSEDLALVRLGYRHRAVAAPTLLVRLDPALSRVGFFDPARKSADTEYARRLQAAFGEGSVRTLQACLLLLRSGADSLSAREFSRMWRHPSRHAYKSLYTPWHGEIRAGSSAYLDPDGHRPVPEPRRWTAGAPRDAELPAPRHLDLVLGGDWRRYGGPQRSMLEEARAAREAGLSVGILHLEALRFATTRDLPLCEPVTELLRRGGAEWVQVDDDVDIDVLMVRYPLVLQHPPTVPQPRPLRPRHLLVVANQAPVEPDHSDQRYVVRDVTQRARELFGTDPCWVPQGPVIRDLLLAEGHGDEGVRLADWDNPGLIDVDQWHLRGDRTPGAGGAPIVVGRFSRDHPLKHPASHAELLAAYDLGPGYEVRLMGSRATRARLAAEAGLDPDTPVPAGWTMLRAGSVPPEEFLAGLDFFLYQDHPERHEAFGRVLLEAAAAGLVVVAHPKHRAVFGELLDYAEPAGSRAVIESYVADPQRYADRVAQMLELVRERYSHASFVRRLESLPGTAEAWAAARERRGDPGRAWRGDAVVRVAPTGDPRQPALVSVQGVDAAGLVARSIPLRSAADAGRADQLVLVHPQELSSASLDRLRIALAAPDGAPLDRAVAEAVASSDDIPLALLVRDGWVRPVGPATTLPPAWVLDEGSRQLPVPG